MTTPLYRRLLLWHKLVAQQTGGLALCSAKRKLNREEALGWVTTLRNVADDIQSVLDCGPFVIDDKGQRVLGSTTASTRPEPKFFNGGGQTSGGPRLARRK